MALIGGIGTMSDAKFLKGMLLAVGIMRKIILLSTLETICQGMLDEFKKQFTGMTIHILWTTILDSRCQSLRHINEIQTAKHKLIKEVIGVPCKEEEFTEEVNGSKRKPSRALISLMLHRKQCHHQHQQQIILK